MTLPSPILCTFLPLLASACAAAAPPPPGLIQPAPTPARYPVQALLETTPVASQDDAADDPAIWVHPSDPAASVLLGTDKSAGLAVYDLSGAQIQFMPVGELNNVDVRYGFTLDGRSVDLIVGGNRSDHSLDVFTIDAASRKVASVAAGRLPLPLRDPYGIALYRSWSTGKFYVFVGDQRGALQQYELIDGEKGVDIALVRSINVGTMSEGMVADDRHARLYVGEEHVGIWRYGAEPSAGDERVLVDSTEAGGHLKADVEGLAIYHLPGGAGYLVASSQGSDDFTVYERTGENRFILKFAVAGGPQVDGCENTDGLDVTSAALGPAFPGGLFIAQDGRNPDANQNFKVVPWHRIVEATAGLLETGGTWDPRESPGR